MSSPPQSPRSSAVFSRDSTPPSPSALNGSPETPTMTPRTKIRSLLRDMSDSDSDATRSPTQPKRGPREPSLQPALLQDQCSETKEKGPEAESEDDEEDNLPVAPKGRMAARMRAQESRTKLASSGSDEDTEREGGETAYERIKRQLAAERKISIPEKGSEKPTSDEQASDAVVPKPIRRRFLLTKKQRAGVDDNTPPQSGQSSPPGSPDVSIAAEDGEQSAPLPIKKKFLFKKKQTQASEETRASSISRKSSPGLFVSPRRPSPSKEAATDASEAGHESDSEAPANPKVSSAFLALVEKKRKEREAKEAAEKKDKAEKAARLKSLHSSLMHSSEDESDQDAAGNKMTQQSRPTRKASKRALEEMNRETQRMSRNMQLAHQARTKKKITKESFFARFNLGQTVPTANASSPATKGDNTSATASSVSPSDAEGGQTRDTPPTSPLAPDDAKKPTLLEGFPILEADEVVMHETEELPSLMELLTRPTPTVTPPVDKGKGKAQKGEPVKEGEFPMEDAVKPKRQIRVKLPSPKTSRNRQPNDSDDDLEILGSASMKKSRALALLDRVPSKRTKEDRALLMLRSLAHLTSHERQGPQNKSSMSSGEMQASLRQKARQQAAQERAEKIQQLKDRGIIVQTAEERERDQQEVEDLIEKGRREAAEIGKKEKEAAKRAGEGGLGDTDDDDEDYAGSEGEDDIVGSEDEDTEDDEGGNQDEDGNDELGLGDGDGLVEKEAVEDDSEKDPEDSEDEANDFIDDIEDEPIEEIMSRKPRVARVISDDEEDEADPYERKPLSTLAVPPRFVMPGLPPSDDLALGLTQAFAATMADSQSQPEPAETQEQDSFAILRNMPEPDFPSLKILEADSQEVIRDSQVQESFNADDVVLDFTQTPARQSVPESPLIGISTQQSMPDPTQDVGFVMSPLLARRGPSSTVETVLLGNPEGSPATKKKGRLMRRADAVPDASIPDDSQSQLAEGGFEIDPSAFDALRKGAKKVATKETFDKTRSNAKEMIEEVAEESEDEYAGLGGASDESAGEEDEEDRKMINDDGKEKVEEQKLAALYADKERISDEAAVTKLYKDLTTGALRRKRGVGSDLDLSDSDDDKEAQRRAKRREFQRMRQAMFADEKLGKIADDKKKSAFLRAIEDREHDEELDLGFSDGEANDNSQSQSQSQIPGDAQNQNDEGAATTSDNDSRKRKRPLEPSDAAASNRLPPNLRRTAAMESQKPSTLDEIRQTVSFLVDEPDSFIAPHPSSDNEGSDQEEEERIPATYDENGEPNEDENDDDLDFIDDSDKPFARPSYTARRTNSEPKPSTSSKSKTTVIDRLSLLRTRTSSLSNSSSNSSRLAFHAPASGPNPGFRVPTLLRRATTNSSINSSGSSTNTSGGFGTERSASDGAKTKVTVAGGSKKASVNFYQKSRLEERERELKGRVGKKGKVPARTAGQGMAGLLGRKGSWD